MSTLLPFCNNLKKGDPVLDTQSNRPAKVARTLASDQQRSVCVRFQGTITDRYVDVMRLRLIVNGQPEELPPIDGEPPSLKREAPSPWPDPKPDADPLAMLKAKKTAHADEIAEMEARCRVIRAEDERLDKAIAALEGK